MCRHLTEYAITIYNLSDLVKGNKMSTSVKKILDSFEKLPEKEKRELASEILRRTAKLEYPSLTDEELILNAGEIFLELDRSEAKEND